MKKSILVLVSLLLVLTLAACGGTVKAPEPTAAPTATPSPTASPEPELTLEPEWLGDAVFEEVKACLFPTDGGKKDVSLAQELLLPLVEEGNPEAMYWRAYIYEYENIEDSREIEKECLYWFKQAAEQGFAKAYIGVALNLYVDSDEMVAEMVDSAKEAGLFELSPEELGPDGCELIGAYYYYTLKNYRLAMEWYSKAADMGCSNSMSQIGWFFYKGLGVARDYNQAKEWFQKSANLGNIAGMVNLASILEQEGELSPAEMLLQAGADAGSAVAMNQLGNYYYEYSTFSRGFPWIKKSAERGFADSMHYTGDAYERGYGVSPDDDLAMEWYIKAYENGLEDAADSINELLSEQKGVNAYFEHYGSLVYPNP